MEKYIFAISITTKHNTMNTEITNLELIETYKGIEIYKHPNPLLSSHYSIYFINGKQYSGPITRMRKTKSWITRVLNKNK